MKRSCRGTLSLWNELKIRVPCVANGHWGSALGGLALMTRKKDPSWIKAME